MQVIIVGDDQPLRVQLARAIGAGRFDVVCAVPRVDQVPVVPGTWAVVGLAAYRAAPTAQGDLLRLRERLGDRLTVVVVASQADSGMAQLVIDELADDFIAWGHGAAFLRARLEVITRRAEARPRSAFVEAVARPQPAGLPASDVADPLATLAKRLATGGRDHLFVWHRDSGVVEWPLEPAPDRLGLPASRAEWDARVHGDDVPLREVALERQLVGGEASGVAVRMRFGEAWHLVLERAVLDGDRRAGRLVGLLTDIEPDVRVEIERRLELKGALVADVAGALAEELNASLLGAFTNLDAVIDASPPGRVRGDLDQARLSLQGAFDWTRRLLALGRRQPPQPEYVSLQDVVQDLVDRLARQLGSHIQLVVESRESPGVVLADLIQLESILSILCDRSARAMPRGGRVVVSLAASTLRDEPGLTPPRASEGRWARLRVSDDGPPLPSAMVEGRFDPLGDRPAHDLRGAIALATARAIVTQHEGFMRGQNPPGGGAAIDVFLPIVTRPPARLRRPESGITTPVGGGELILVCDDDELVLRMIEKLLRTAGYRVLTAPDGDRGVALFEEHRNEVRLCVFDIVMPVMGGRVASERVRAIDPQVPCLFMSGYTMSIQDTEFVQDPSRRFMPKPFNAGQLLREVRQAIAGH